METWIKLYRKFSEWEWFNVSEMVHLFIYLLLNANNTDNEWRGVKVKRGQMITGRKTLHEKTGISEQTLRTCLKRLENTKEITIRSTNKYTIIKLENYCIYQGKEIVEQPTKQPTNNQTSNQQVTTTKEVKEIKEDKNINIERFNEFWNLYNYKKAKPKAEVAYKKALKNDSHENIMLGVDNYIKNRGVDSTYWKHPTTWLNSESWKDEYQTKANNHNNFNKQDYDKGTEGFIVA